MSENADTTSFEVAFNALQEIITRLEGSELTLEESLRLYEEGRRFSDICTSILNAAQLRVETLTKEEPASGSLPDQEA